LGLELHYFERYFQYFSGFSVIWTNLDISGGNSDYSLEKAAEGTVRKPSI
jgi:hypothetical protein